MRSVRVLVAIGVVLAAVSVTTAAGLRRQAAVARRRIGKPLGESAPIVDRVWRTHRPGPPLDVLLVGDSLAAGLGATRPRETFGGRIARGLGAVRDQQVRLRRVAVVGAESSDLAGQLDRLEDDYRPAVAVIVVGGNDVTHRVPVAASVRALTDAIARLQERGAQVVVCTCPDLGALRAVPQPLRTLASRLSRRLAAAQADGARRVGAVTVDLRRTVGPLFLDMPDEMFSLDRFHPSALGYRRMAAVVLPSVLAALRDA